jgi:hypothetical protein
MSGIMMAAAASVRQTQIALTNHTVSDLSAGGSAGAQLLLNNDGTADFQRTVGSDGTYSGEWIVGAPVSSAIAGLYEVVVTLTSGTFSTGAAGTFNLGTSRLWAVSAGAGANKTATATFSIRRVADAAVMATATVTLTADGTS